MILRTELRLILIWGIVTLAFSKQEALRCENVCFCYLYMESLFFHLLTVLRETQPKEANNYKILAFLFSFNFNAIFCKFFNFFMGFSCAITFWVLFSKRGPNSEILHIWKACMGIHIQVQNFSQNRAIKCLQVKSYVVPKEPH